MVTAIVVAPDHQRAMYYVREWGWNPRDVVIVTPGNGFRVRGLRGVPVHWAGWNPEDRASLTLDDGRALRLVECWNAYENGK